MLLALEPTRHSKVTFLYSPPVAPTWTQQRVTVDSHSCLLRNGSPLFPARVCQEAKPW